MRPIDADDFREKMDMICDAGGYLQPITEAVREYVKIMIDRQPTVQTALDKAEKPKAKWTMITFDIGDFKSRDGKTYELSITSARCSNCERYSEVLQQYRPIPTRYCPHCGAEMEVNK